MSYSSESDYAYQVQKIMDIAKKQAGERKRSLASKMFRAVRDITVAVVAATWGPVAGVGATAVSALLGFFFD